MRYLMIVFVISMVVGDASALRGYKFHGLKNLNNVVYKTCIREAYNITKNKEVFDCMSVNRSNDCNHLERFDEFNHFSMECVRGKNSEIGVGVLISIMILAILGFVGNN